MKIAIPREQRPDEARVAASPESVKKLVALGFEVVVETGAGQGAAMLDAAYEKAGASIAADAAAACAGADVIAKVRRPLPGEFAGLKAGALVICIMDRSEEHTSELQSLMRISYAVFCLKKKTKQTTTEQPIHTPHNDIHN